MRKDTILDNIAGIAILLSAISAVVIAIAFILGVLFPDSIPECPNHNWAQMCRTNVRREANNDTSLFN